MIATNGVSRAQRERFEHEGYLIVREALTAEALSELEAAVDRTWARERGAPPTAGDAPLHLLAFAGRERSFLELLDHPTTLPHVMDVLGWNIFMYHCHLDVHPPELDGAPGWRWHQDGGRQNVELEGDPRPRMSVKVAYFLSDCSEPGRGNFRVLPGSHVRNRLARPEEGGVPDPAGAVEILARPGDAVLFDRRLWHMRGVNRSRTVRRALFYAYTYRWVRARDDLVVRPSLLGCLTPARAQLLGAGEGAIGHWIPSDADVPLRVG